VCLGGGGYPWLLGCAYGTACVSAYSDSRTQPVARGRGTHKQVYLGVSWFGGWGGGQHDSRQGLWWRWERVVEGFLRGGGDWALVDPCLCISKACAGAHADSRTQPAAWGRATHKQVVGRTRGGGGGWKIEERAE
jgi:hypothetical protein